MQFLKARLLHGAVFLPSDLPEVFPDILLIAVFRRFIEYFVFHGVRKILLVDVVMRIIMGVLISGAVPPELAQALAAYLSEARHSRELLLARTAAGLAVAPTVRDRVEDVLDEVAVW